MSASTTPIKDPIVSVCIQTYQHKNYIRKTIDSVLMQKTDFSYEILIGEDESTDGTRDICIDYAKRYPTKIHLSLNSRKNVIIIGGQPTGKWNFMNNIKNSRGKYVALLPGDDYWTDPYKLQKQIDFLEANPDYVISYHNARIIDDKGNLIEQSKLPDNLKRDYSSEELIIGAWVLPLSMCFRNVVQDMPDEFIRVYNGDIFLTSLLGNFGKGKYMYDISDAVYRKHASAIWSPLDEITKIYRNGDTRAWLHRYYRRIGQDKYANFFKNDLLNHFGIVLQKIALSHDHQYEYIIQNIFTNYADIIQEELEIYHRKLSESPQDHLNNDLLKMINQHTKNRKNNSIISWGLLSDTLSLYEAGKLNEAEKCLSNCIKQIKDANQ